MGALDGNVKTPFGEVSKKTAAMVGGGAALLLLIVWYRTKKAKAVAAAGANTGINPATGYPYGSPEDAAALANQASFVTPTGGGGGGGATTGGFVSNAQWTQDAINKMVSAGAVADPQLLSIALGRYITGQPAGDAVNLSLIQQAIAFEGYPPVAGTNGYPPSINTSNPVPTPEPTPTPTPTPTPAPVQIPATLVAPAYQDLDTWCQTAVIDVYHIPYTFTRMQELNPGLPIKWVYRPGPDGNSPQLTVPTTVRIG